MRSMTGLESSPFFNTFNFFTAIREQKPVYENATFGLRAAAPALLCNDSLRLGKVMSWDPVQLKVES